jgi:hypothetical protein
MKKKLPIGKSTLEKMIKDNCTYVDKTQFVAQLVESGGYCFLSRPRRFGKSLFLDILKQAFLGNKEIFKGLYLENNWDWGKKYPVIHLSFGESSGAQSAAVLHDIIDSQLQAYAKEFDIVLPNYQHSTQFDFLIKSVAQKSVEQKIVILVDECDKPILDVIDHPEQARANREVLRGLYSVIKENDAYLKFVSLTGVSKFSKSGLFSGLNHLNDITLDARYADICGYTQIDLEREFAAYLTEGNVDKEKSKSRYNGYNFAGSEDEKVYNPFDILLFFDKSFQYKNYRFETGNPSFLIKLIQKNKYYFLQMERVSIQDSVLSSFDVDHIPLTPLLFQAGYLTIKEITTIGTQYAYVLGYPNAEVKASLNALLTTIGTTIEQRTMLAERFNHCLRSTNLDDIGEILGECA